MILLAALASLAAVQAHAAVDVATGRASGRVLHAAVSSEREWKDASHKLEIRIREADGRITRLRVIEHE